MNEQPPSIEYRPRGARDKRGWRYDVLHAAGTLWVIGMTICVLAIAAILFAWIASCIDDSRVPRIVKL